MLIALVATTMASYQPVLAAESAEVASAVTFASNFAAASSSSAAAG